MLKIIRISLFTSFVCAFPISALAIGFDTSLAEAVQSANKDIEQVNASDQVYDAINQINKIGGRHCKCLSSTQVICRPPGESSTIINLGVLCSGGAN